MSFEKKPKNQRLKSIPSIELYRVSPYIAVTASAAPALGPFGITP